MAKSVLKERGLKKIRLGIEGKTFSLFFLINLLEPARFKSWIPLRLYFEYFEKISDK